jgi:hypothetical protein
MRNSRFDIFRKSSQLETTPSPSAILYLNELSRGATPIALNIASERVNNISWEHYDACGWLGTEATNSGANWEHIIADTIRRIGSLDNRTNMELRTLKEFIRDLFGEIEEVEMVYCFRYKGHIQINTIMHRSDFTARKKVYAAQRKINEQFPENIIEFNLIFSDNGFSHLDIPDSAQVCFNR